MFGIQHWIPLALMVFFSVVLSILGKRVFNEQTKLQVSRFMSLSICIWAIAYFVILIAIGKFNYKQDLPFELCNLMAILMPFLMWNPKYKYHEMLYFMVLAGTMQAIITPYLYNGFPNFIYLKYWIVHCGLVVVVIYHTVAFDMKPTLKSIWRAFIGLNLYVLFALIINLCLGSNYGYVLGKPPTASVLDYLGPWPWYIFVCEFLGVIVFFICYLPIALFGKKNAEVRSNLSIQYDDNLRVD